MINYVDNVDNFVGKPTFSTFFVVFSVDKLKTPRFSISTFFYK